jgi:U3 small nucleolar RNA-associated protein 22
MNYRYFNKRAYYLAVLAAALQENKLGLNVKVEFGTLDGDNRRPILLLLPSGGQYIFKILYNYFEFIIKY